MTIPQQENPPEQVSTGEQDTSSIFSDFDLYLFGQGKHRRIYEKMGAHPRTVDGVVGVNFALWAPNARTVSVIGDFNGDRKSTRLNSSHGYISYAVFCLQ